MDQLDLNVNPHAQWRVLHTNYVMAHEQYMRAKLLREVSQGQPTDPTGFSIARSQLAEAQEALAGFFERHAEFA